MVMALVLLAVLFIAGLTHTLFNFPTKKFMVRIDQFFCTQSTSQRAPINLAMAEKKVVKTISSHEKAELRSVFATFDKNNDGFITKQELRESLRNVGIQITEGEVGDMVEKLDSNGDGLIDLDEFCELFKLVVRREKVGGEDEEEDEDEEEGEGDLKEAFDVFDGDRDGLISVEELGMVLSSLGLKEGQRSENCKEMIRKVDLDGDGMVNFHEFKRMMRNGGSLVAVS